MRHYHFLAESPSFIPPLCLDQKKFQMDQLKLVHLSLVPMTLHDVAPEPPLKPLLSLTPYNPCPLCSSHTGLFLKQAIVIRIYSYHTSYSLPRLLLTHLLREPSLNTQNQLTNCSYLVYLSICILPGVWSTWHVLLFRSVYCDVTNIVDQCDIPWAVQTPKAPPDCTVTENKNINVALRQDWIYTAVLRECTCFWFFSMVGIKRIHLWGQ